MGRRTGRHHVLRWSVDGVVSRPDTLAAEEPLEIRIGGQALTVTMRTPGDDVDLVLGFLVSEGVIRSREDVRTVSYCAGSDAGEANTYNILDVSLDPATSAARPARHVLTTSACGLCGRTSIDEVRTRLPYDVAGDEAAWTPAAIAALPDALQLAQQVFQQTGGLHAAALFDDAAAAPLVVREDVGRHNAVDKVVGWALREDRLPARGTVLVVSGRASFELVQKAAVAGIPALVAVSAPSSLAVDLARETGLTLVGFARGATMNVYSRGDRLGLT
ncbi:MAG TPA: formate dehydrogenase accessory sulfurtransferase FdhD [Mycobacteriales bacterium]|nr:formate dehydrogenase accessory sulfurtransferase FdhD [Mycobacteriales bacterium]